jgi:hypothetical protein
MRAGVTSYNGIAAKFNERNVRTARGAKARGRAAAGSSRSPFL